MEGSKESMQMAAQQPEARTELRLLVLDGGPRDPRVVHGGRAPRVRDDKGAAWEVTAWTGGGAPRRPGFPSAARAPGRAQPPSRHPIGIDRAQFAQGQVMLTASALKSGEISVATGVGLRSLLFCSAPSETTGGNSVTPRQSARYARLPRGMAYEGAF
jgi:hypothetical protein